MSLIDYFDVSPFSWYLLSEQQQEVLLKRLGHAVKVHDDKIIVRPRGWVLRLADSLMKPVMYLVSGTLREEPQMTHRWNNHKLGQYQIRWLLKENVLLVPGMHGTNDRGILRFHIPLFGGWKQYVVLEPEDGKPTYHIGWNTDDVCGISRIPITGAVRMLVGPSDALFFAVEATSGQQIKLRSIGKEKIGDGGPFSHFPLL